MSHKISAPPSPRYLTILCEFMAFFHEKSIPYPKDHEFTADDLAVITPSDVCKWMKFKAFGTSDPGPDAKLTGSGSSSLEFMKKAVSYYMPVKGNYDEARKCGNPTRSRQVKDLLHRVAVLGGKKKREVVAAQYSQVGTQHSHGQPIPLVAGGGQHGLLRRVLAQNNEFINILSTMGSALRTFDRSLEQMKSALETSNIAIRHELSNVNKGDGDDDDGDDELADETMSEGVKTDIPSMEAEMKQHVAQVAETLQDFMNSNVVTNRDMTVISGADGFCTFGSNDSGKQMDIPEGFVLPSVDLCKAWYHWIAGFPDFKVKNDNGEIIDAPIRPLRFVNTTNIPHSLKKTFKDGWRPILLSMIADVAQMLETTPIAAIDAKFVQDSYDVAMKALVQKAPAIFSDYNAEKFSKWKVATWSRKIREQQLGQQQVRRSVESSGATPMDTEDEDGDVDEEIDVEEQVVGQLKLMDQPTQPSEDRCNQPSQHYEDS
ncbi:hypothetical protein ACHAXA_007538 [Cyclostephanos tholiformis]|uniref:ESCRT-II complex subunit VPS36 n=1 Tax=Cyclostephanos tholiformis TaxID=382380 RepID=A0ABD3SQZ9_9STRA